MTSTAIRLETVQASQASAQTADREADREADRKGEYHSVLAMEAARKMRRTRKKRETGQAVCHHLKMMLASEPVPVREINGRTDLVYPNGRTPRPLHSEPQFTLFEHS